MIILKEKVRKNKMSKRLGNYSIKWCNKHGKYFTVPGGEHRCPKCEKERKESKEKESDSLKNKRK